MTPLKKLFSPFRIGNLEVKNRIVMPPMATNYAEGEGFVSERHIAYYIKRAKGGVGYITFEHTAVTKLGRAFPNMARIDSDQHIPPFRRLIDAVHREDGRIVIQINHAGRQTSSSIIGSSPVGPSAIPCPVRGEMPRELSCKEIQEIIKAFGEAASRVREAGADGVEIHMAHGYLISQFLSPFSNHRTDEYGGDPERRITMAIEVLTTVRNAVGADFPVICRLSADEYVEGGLRLEDSQKIAQTLEKNGADALHISACVGASGYLIHPPYYVEEGLFTHLARGIKSVVGIPVITVGRIRTPELANQILEESKADLISMGRALIADPNLPVKAFEGRLDDIIPCISCNRCAQSIRVDALQCAVNPETGREGIFIPQKAHYSKNVWIIGGGPAGMKAAEIAALRGHQVTLYERKGALGGRFLAAAIPPRKGILKEFIMYLAGRLDKLGVKVILNKDFDFGELSDSPDVLIFATGAQSSLPEIDGVQESSIFSAEDALLGSAPLGERVIVIGGGGVGAEIADHLSESGREVTLIEMKEEIAVELPIHLQYFLKKRLCEKGVKILTSTKVLRFEKEGLWVESPLGRERIERFDSVIVSLGLVPDEKLTSALKDKGINVHVIGDASNPRELKEAVLEGEEIALKI